MIGAKLDLSDMQEAPPSQAVLYPFGLTRTMTSLCTVVKEPTGTLPSIAFQQLHQYHDPSFTGLVSSQKEPATLTLLSTFHKV